MVLTSQYYVRMEGHDPNIGRRVALGPPWKFSTTPAKVKHYGPLLGEHTEYVLGELLGMPEAEIAALREEGVLP